MEARRALWILAILAFYVLSKAFGPDDADSPRRPKIAAPPTIETRRPAPRSGPKAIIDRGIVRVPERVGAASGTAFAIGGDYWLTARHVVDGCGRVGLIVGPGRATQVQLRAIAPDGDVALVRSTAPGPDLAMAPQSPSPGAVAFHVGFPQSKPGEVRSRFLGWAEIRARGRYVLDERLLAFVEIERTPGLKGSLGGLSGGPTFDSDGRVIGVVSAESPRRGRIYVSATETVRAAIDAAQVPNDGRPRARFDEAGWRDAAASLRGAAAVRRTICVPEGGS